MGATMTFGRSSVFATDVIGEGQTTGDAWMSYSSKPKSMMMLRPGSAPARATLSIPAGAGDPLAYHGGNVAPPPRSTTVMGPEAIDSACAAGQLFLSRYGRPVSAHPRMVPPQRPSTAATAQLASAYAPFAAPKPAGKPKPRSAPVPANTLLKDLHLMVTRAQASNTGVPDEAVRECMRILHPYSRP